jgi:hypothetical protein
MANVDFNLQVVGGKIEFGPTKGNGYSAGNRTFVWNCDQAYEFKLTFEQREYGGLPTPATPWPFRDAPPVPPDSTGWVPSFTGKADKDGAYKYSVEVRDRNTKAPVADEDPMIIVGRV